jgi:hypothetical protein
MTDPLITPERAAEIKRAAHRNAAGMLTVLLGEWTPGEHDADAPTDAEKALLREEIERIAAGLRVLATATTEPVPLAMARMFPHGNAAVLAARILADAALVEDALHTLVFDPEPGVTLDQTELAELSDTVREFRDEIERETANRETRPAEAPVAGTTGTDVVKTIANAMLTMPGPQGVEDQAWRRRAHDQAYAVGERYEQTWRDHSMYWAFVRSPHKK